MSPRLLWPSMALCLVVCAIHVGGLEKRAGEGDAGARMAGVTNTNSGVHRTEYTNSFADVRLPHIHTACATNMSSWHSPGPPGTGRRNKVGNVCAVLVIHYTRHSDAVYAYNGLKTITVSQEASQGPYLTSMICCGALPARISKL